MHMIPLDHSNKGSTNTAAKDDTDLTTLIGSKREYERLVKNCFTEEEDGNIRWEAANGQRLMRG